MEPICYRQQIYGTVHCAYSNKIGTERVKWLSYNLEKCTDFDLNFCSCTVVYTKNLLHVC